MNKIAIIGHTGWVGRAITSAFIDAGVPIRIIHRAGSDLSSLPHDIERVEIDWGDPKSFEPALKGIDILMYAQISLIPALQHCKVKLFVPTNLSLPYTEEEREQVPVPRAKQQVDDALHEANVPFAVILAGNFAEFALGTPALGVDIPNNRMVLTGDAKTQEMKLCTVPYVAAAFVHLFAHTPPSELVGRTIGLNEFTVTGEHIRLAMESQHGTSPRIAQVGVSDADKAIAAKHPMALAYLVRKKWGTGTLSVGTDVFDVPSYNKTTAIRFIHDGAGQYAYAGFLKAVDCDHFLDSYFA